MNKDSFSYKKGFVKGIEIYSENLSNSGYYADTNNKRTMENCKKYAESGYKNQIRLTDNQKDYYYGLSDGIAYKYRNGGTPLENSKHIRRFEKREQAHYYGNNIDEEIF